MTVLLYIAAFGLLAICFWLIFRPEAAEQAAYSGYLVRQQQKQQSPGDGTFTVTVCLLLPVGIIAIFSPKLAGLVMLSFVIMSLVHLIGQR